MKLQVLAVITSLALSATAAIIEPRLFNTARFPRPSLDPFYRLPDNLASLPKGAIVRSRSVPSFLDPLVKSTTQVFYRTETADGRPDGTIATLITPLKVAPGPPKILVVLLPQDSSAFDCDISYSQVPYTDSSSAQAVIIPNAPVYYAALAQGWYIVTPSHEGSQAAFIAGPGSGKATIDGLRAALNFKGFLPFTTGYKASVYGYSGAAHAAAWANQLASTAYGRDLNVLGAAYGGTPAYLRPVVDYLNKGLFTGFAGAGVVGLMNAYPELNDYVSSVSHPNGTAAVAEFRSSASCALQELTSFAFKDFYSYVKVANVLDQPIPSKYIKLNDLGKTVLRKPAFIYHSTGDEVIEFAQLERYVRNQCSRGAKITFRIASTGGHFTTLFTGLPAAFAWLIQLMEGTLLELTECETIRGPLVGLGTPEAVAVLGPRAVAASLALNGMKIGGITVKL